MYAYSAIIYPVRSIGDIMVLARTPPDPPPRGPYIQKWLISNVMDT